MVDRKTCLRNEPPDAIIICEYRTKKDEPELQDHVNRPLGLTTGSLKERIRRNAA